MFKQEVKRVGGHNHIVVNKQKMGPRFTRFIRVIEEGPRYRVTHGLNRRGIAGEDVKAPRTKHCAGFEGVDVRMGISRRHTYKHGRMPAVVVIVCHCSSSRRNLGKRAVDYTAGRDVGGTVLGNAHRHACAERSSRVALRGILHQHNRGLDADALRRGVPRQ